MTWLIEPVHVQGIECPFIVKFVILEENKVPCVKCEEVPTIKRKDKANKMYIVQCPCGVKTTSLDIHDAMQLWRNKNENK